MLETGLYAYVQAGAALTALIGDRVYPITAPQAVSLPYMTFQRVSTQPTHDLSGPDPLSKCRVQFDCYGEQPLGAKQVSEALRALIDGYQGMMGTVSVRAVMRANERDLSVPETETYRISCDYWISFLED